MSNLVENCRALPFVLVDFHSIHTDGRISASSRGCQWRLTEGQRVLAVDWFGAGRCEATVGAILSPFITRKYKDDLILDLDRETWCDDA